ncbi:tubulin-like doman-containing protein [Tessaracoccus flavus]|uniref:Uncharacterized protein n=1 Tax=Tessaracoccus flavus TaxID=1610493 RepID=A0A1Q2CH52_9ACTN|nr:tubulin-like doman-containing protein [Tessaracoccus flavus]AQP45448.1 hypothetical protein RPIT_12075 [Tessaracoccus flavus]SDY91966.1 Tubulin like [Tessaracoccus flavus]
MAFLRRFLVVGCGGSGAATLAHMMDELSSELGAHGVEKLPEGWQFVEVDVPVTPQGNASGIEGVQARGGSYIGLGVQAGLYPALDSAMATGPLLDRFAPWAVRDPAKYPVAISAGAGQVRAIGRMVTLNRYSYLQSNLSAAWQRLNSSAAHTDMSGVADAMGFEYQMGADPLVFIVSSMAGGAGASMALDVARLLGNLPGYPHGLVGMFMVAADVFNSLPRNERAGVRPNSLAMLGEIVAAQTKASVPTDTTDMRSAGVVADSGAASPFMRVFPVSAHVGATQAPFGDGTPKDVYRGLGRGLAALMRSPGALAQYEAFDLVNHSFLTPTVQAFGWDESPNLLDWGSFGYSALSMGRDRYAEYAAQRLARGAVDQALEGHLRDAGPGDDPGTVLKRLNARLWPRTAAALQLHDPEQHPSFGSWLSTYVWPQSATRALAADVAQGAVSNIPAADGQDPVQWLAEVRRHLSLGSDEAKRSVSRQVRSFLWTYQGELVSRVQEQVSTALATYGIPLALEHLNTLSSELGRMSQLASQASVSAPILGMPEKLNHLVGAIRGRVGDGAALGESLRDGLLASVQPHLYGELAAGLAEIWRDFREHVLDPIGKELTERLRMLRSAVDNARGGQTSLAVLATAEYGQWPAPGESKVSERFARAFNEILVTSSDEYLDQFSRDVSRALTEGPSREFDLWQAVLSGVWETADGTQPPGGLIRERSEWVPEYFDADPAGKPLVARPLNVEATLSPEEILERAREFVWRRGSSFQQFANESLADYVNNAPLADQAVRRSLIVTKFRQALSAAMPLAAPSPEVVAALYGEAVLFRYKISDIPFEHDPILPDALRKVVTTDATIDQPTTLGNLNASLKPPSSVKKIDIFGSYQNYLPICFSSVLDPIREQWAASTSSTQRMHFWDGRRARPLPAGLPMGDHERRAMVAGWFVGQIVGKVRFPDVQHHAQSESVEVFDNVTSKWLPFPSPMLTSFAQRRSVGDLLPSVLEAYLVAMLQAGAGGEPLSSLKPYHALRSLYDSYEVRTTQGWIAAELELAQVLRGEADFPGTSRVKDLATLDSLDERIEAIRDFLTRARGSVLKLRDFKVGNRTDAAAVPVIRDLVSDILWALGDLEERLGSAAAIPSETPGTAAGADMFQDVL